MAKPKIVSDVKVPAQFADGKARVIRFTKFSDGRFQVKADNQPSLEIRPRLSGGWGVWVFLGGSSAHYMKASSARKAYVAAIEAYWKNV